MTQYLNNINKGFSKTVTPVSSVSVTVFFSSWCFLFQLLLERKSKEVGKLIEETEKSIKDLADNISQAKVNS